MNNNNNKENMTNNTTSNIDNNKYKSMCDTYKHKQQVNNLMVDIANKLLTRGLNHDNSKLESPEVDIFAEYTPKLAATTYGSDEYKQYLKEMKPALEHHYANNIHHPEHHKRGVADMDLVDLIEMICDWYAASKRHDDGDIYESIKINKRRFGYSEELEGILNRTVYNHFK